MALLVSTVGYAQDTDPDTLRAADVNADGVINILDLTLVASHFGETPTADQSPNPDVNGGRNCQHPRSDTRRHPFRQNRSATYSVG